METKLYFREFLKYSSLNVLGMIALSCYILADTFFVSKALGADGGAEPGDPGLQLYQRERPDDRNGRRDQVFHCEKPGSSAEGGSDLYEFGRTDCGHRRMFFPDRAACVRTAGAPARRGRYSV